MLVQRRAYTYFEDRITTKDRGIRAGSLLRDAEKAIEEGAKHR